MVVGTWRSLSDDEKGKADIFCILAPKGRLFCIEIKFGEDKQSEHQKKFQERATDAGAIYYECKDYNAFVSYYEQSIKPLL